MTKKHIVTIALNDKQFSLLQEYMSKRLINFYGRAFVDALVWAFSFLFSKGNCYNDKMSEQQQEVTNDN